MANDEHLAILMDALDKNDITIWNKWRDDNPNITPDLREADLNGKDLGGANLTSSLLENVEMNQANLQSANLSRVNLINAKATKANFREVKFTDSWLGAIDLTSADLTRTDFTDAYLVEANLTRANLRESLLIRTNMERSILDYADFTHAQISDCEIGHVSILNTIFTPSFQNNLITDFGLVDDFKFAQFIDIWIKNIRIRESVGTFGRNTVLIVENRFKQDKRLDSIKTELKRHNYVTITTGLYHAGRGGNPAWDKQTIRLVALAQLSRFVIIDFTDLDVDPEVIKSFAEQIPWIPIIPIVQQREGKEFTGFMLERFFSYKWVSELIEYINLSEFISTMKEKIIDPAEHHVKILQNGLSESSSPDNLL